MTPARRQYSATRSWIAVGEGLPLPPSSSAGMPRATGQGEIKRGRLARQRDMPGGGGERDSGPRWLEGWQETTVPS